MLSWQGAISLILIKINLNAYVAYACNLIYLFFFIFFLSIGLFVFDLKVIVFLRFVDCLQTYLSKNQSKTLGITIREMQNFS